MTGVAKRTVLKLLADLGEACDDLPRQDASRSRRAKCRYAGGSLGRSVAAHIDLLTPIAAAVHAQTRTTDATGLPVLDIDVPDGMPAGCNASRYAVRGVLTPHRQIALACEMSPSTVSDYL